ncbi:MAG: SDR family NAD(P)-dependent oxidoreductase [Hyphomonadaceae bacterium]
MSGSLQGKAAIVTGAAGGMGRVYAHRLAKLGADVAILDIDLNVAKRHGEELTAESVEAEIRAMGRRAIGVEADLAKPDAAAGAVQRVIDEFGRLDILVNNAGGAIAPFDRSAPSQTPQADIDLMLGANFLSMVYCSQSAIPHLRKTQGAIVNVSTIGVDMDIQSGKNAMYSAAKAALLRFSRSMAVELGPDGVRVNCIAPGQIDTARVKAAAAARNLGTPEQAKHIPLRRIGKPEDVAGALEFLVTDLSAYVTGECIRVSGGYQLVGPV